MAFVQKHLYSLVPNHVNLVVDVFLILLVRQLSLFLNHYIRICFDSEIATFRDFCGCSGHYGKREKLNQYDSVVPRLIAQNTEGKKKMGDLENTVESSQDCC